MGVYLPSAVAGNAETLLTFGETGEIMAWFYPHKDHAQQIYQCMPCYYAGYPGQGALYWTWGAEWVRRQDYLEDTNILRSVLASESLGLEIEFLDLVPEEGT